MTQQPSSSSAVDWRAPDAKADAIFGAGATRAEKALANGVGLVGAAVLVVAAWATDAAWNIWLVLVAAVLAFDVVGGVVANGLNAAKRDHFGPPSATAGTVGGRLVRHPIVFTALHVHPVIVGLLYPPHLWWWGIPWYLAILAATVLVRVAPLYLQRPVALGCCALVALGSSLTPAPDLWAWLPVMLALKLVLAHAVQEEPYRPAARPA